MTPAAQAEAYYIGGEWMEVVHMIEEKVKGEVDGQR